MSFDMQLFYICNVQFTFSLSTSAIWLCCRVKFMWVYWSSCLICRASLRLLKKICAKIFSLHVRANITSHFTWAPYIPLDKWLWIMNPWWCQAAKFKLNDQLIFTVPKYLRSEATHACLKEVASCLLLCRVPILWWLGIKYLWKRPTIVRTG